MAVWTVRDGFKYAKTDEWMKLDGSEAVVGISDYAQDQLSDLVFIELPKVGASFQAGQSFGVVESVKAAADLNMPVSGEVIAVNNALEGSPEQMNRDPYGEGWIVRIRVTNADETGGLMSADEYQAYCEQRN